MHPSFHYMLLLFQSKATCETTLKFLLKIQQQSASTLLCAQSDDQDAIERPPILISTQLSTESSFSDCISDPRSCSRDLSDSQDIQSSSAERNASTDHHSTPIIFRLNFDRFLEPPDAHLNHEEEMNGADEASECISQTGKSKINFHTTKTEAIANFPDGPRVFPVSVDLFPIDVSLFPLDVFVIERFHPRRLPSQLIGQFSSKDAYIVLRVCWHSTCAS